ncbi:site-specific tyrosine recombinase/integron integrase [Phosphitispora fastidiosa]|uniref:site-specific tyrosine recombinase/integron integrase n=1 Tax=Phosphitispora fastidiosa TaxID=2837202 RepID=UPI001E2EF7C3|nr:site-specific tyrosine recombinase/integron integrase [Phosphitispora fastidiosa]MBU7006051.1 site-specific recombinase XerD [Phosphitispora fastidiosa]
MTKEEILQKLLFQTRLRGLSRNTQNEYFSKVKQFQDHYDKPATELTLEDIQNFLYFLLAEKGLSPATVNTYNSGLRFLYTATLDVPINLNKLPCHRKQRKFPDILTRKEVSALFDACDNLRDKCMLMTMYSAGLRISEVANLKVSDIDSQKMQLLIRDGKGGKDRFAILSQACLDVLREYWKQYRPTEWLFYSRNRTGTHITRRAIQNVFHKYKDLAGITKNVTSHTLRHSFATHLLENGVSIFHIKQLLGHSDISTTCFYLHLVKISELNVASPLDTPAPGAC